jgi:recombination protein RecA
MSKESQLEEDLKVIRKQYGAGAIQRMSEHRAAEPIEVISTRCAAIDDLTGIGGLPKSRITEVFGPESGGKTTLCLHVVAEAQSQGGLAAVIDAEHALNMDFASEIGVDVDNLLISQPDCGEDALEIVLTLIRGKALSVIVVDSVAALIPRSELDGNVGDAQMGLQARMMSQSLRMLVGAVNHSGTALIFVNQVRDKIGQMFGNPETTTGGRALKFYSSMRIDLRRIEQIKKSDTIIGQRSKVKIIKNKMAPPYRSAEVPLIYGKGFVNLEGKK